MEAPKTPQTLAEKVAEEIFRTIERERRIVKADLVEAAEKILKATEPRWHGHTVLINA